MASSAAAAAAASKPLLRVLCFGDSLTSGYHHYGLDSHPYSVRLRERLDRAFPGKSIEVVTSGVPGDAASFPRFAKRLTDECDKRYFDWVIVMGGTNDLAFGMFSDDIFSKLQHAWDIALARNSRVLALTVPPINVRSPRLDRVRQDLNSRILDYKESNYYAYDIKTQIDFLAAAPDSNIDDYWDDDVHFSSQGYDFIGERVADGIIPLIEEADRLDESDNEAPAPSSSSAGKTVDGAAREYEEESGDPQHLSQGYVFVRQSDLD